MDPILHLEELVPSGVVEFPGSFQINGTLKSCERIGHFLIHNTIEGARIESEVLQTLLHSDHFLDGIEIAEFERTFQAVFRHPEMAGAGKGIDVYFEQAGLVGFALVYFAVDLQNEAPVCQRNVEAFNDEPELRGRALLDEPVKPIGAAGFLPDDFLRDLDHVAGKEHVGILAELLKIGIRFPERLPEKTVSRGNARDTVSLLHDVLQPANSQVKAITGRLYQSTLEGGLPVHRRFRPRLRRP
jgi:hypothetical protein